jgi:hypothetical protein
MLAGLAPDDEPHAGRGGVGQRHRRAGLGFHLATPSLSSCGSRRRIDLRRRQGLAGWLRPKLIEDRSQSADVRRKGVSVALDDVVQLLGICVPADFFQSRRSAPHLAGL